MIIEASRVDGVFNLNKYLSITKTLNEQYHNIAKVDNEDKTGGVMADIVSKFATIMNDKKLTSKADDVLDTIEVDAYDVEIEVKNR